MEEPDEQSYLDKARDVGYPEGAAAYALISIAEDLKALCTILAGIHLTLEHQQDKEDDRPLPF